MPIPARRPSVRPEDRSRLREQRWYPWLALALLFLVATLNYADRTAFTTVFPLLRRDLGMSDMGLAGIGTAFLWAYALSSPFAGLIGDRFPRRLVVIGCLGAWSLVMMATSFVQTSSHLLLMRALLGLAESLYIPSAIALLGEFHTGSTRATALAIHTGGFYFGMVVGGTFSAYFSEQNGWRTTIFSLGLAGVLLAAVCWFLLQPPPPLPNATHTEFRPPASIPETLRRVLRIPSFLILAGDAMLIAIGTWIFTNWLPLYFLETFHLSLGQAGFAGTIATNAGAVAGLLAGGWISDRAAARDPARRMLWQAVFCFAAVPFLVAFLYSSNLVLVAVLLIVYSFLRTLSMSNESPTICDVLPRSSWSTALGLMNFTNTLAGGLGILMAGYWKARLGLTGAFTGVAIAMLIGAALLALGYRFYIGRDLAAARAAENA